MLALEPWRVRESQFVNATRKLTDSDEEQRVLEELLDARAKPALPEDVRHLHYLLATPFRHPPLRNGSRFGTRSERGIFYGARELATCLAEVAYYRHVFREGTQAELGQLEAQHTAFRVAVRTERGVDLTLPPFDAFAPVLASPVDYTQAQALGREMRAAGVEAFLFHSARARVPGTCAAVLAPAAFARPRPLPGAQEWVSVTDARQVEFRRKSALDPVGEVLTFPREDFLVEGVLPQPALA